MKMMDKLQATIRKNKGENAMLEATKIKLEEAI